MDRNKRDARRATAVSASITPSLSNGLLRRRHRTSLRDSLEEDSPLELPDMSRSGLRDRHVGGKQDREQIDRLDRDRDRDRERLLRNKRWRGDGNNHRLINNGGSGNKVEGLGVVADDSSEESVNENEDEDDDEHHHHHQHTRLLHSASALTSSATMMLNNSRRSYPPSASAMAAPAGAAPKASRPVWKVTDEMNGVLVPRKARSASAKRSHDCWVGGGATASHASGDQALRQPSTSPVRPGLVASSPANNRPASPSSSNASAHKKLRLNGPKQRPPPKSVSKPVSSVTQDEIEIAEVLYGMTRQPQGPSPKSEVSFGGESMKTEVSRDENNMPTPLPNSGSVLPQQNSSSSIPLISTIAPKRKKPRAMKYDEEIQAQSMYPVRNSPITAKIEMDTMSKFESLESNKTVESLAGDAKEEFPYLAEESRTLQLHGDVRSNGKVEPKRSCGAPEVENYREDKFQIDLMAPLPTRSSPGRDGGGDDFSSGADHMSIISKGSATALKEGVNAVDEEEVKREAEGEGGKSATAGGGDGKGVDLQIDLERVDDGGGMAMMMMMGNGSLGAVSKGSLQHLPKKLRSPVADKSAPTAGPLTFPIPLAGWPGGLPPMGYMPPLPGVTSVDRSAVASTALQPPPLLFNQQRPKRCTTHCYVAWNISYHQQMARIPLWPAAGSMSLYGAKPCNVDAIRSADPNGHVLTRSVNSGAEKGQNLGLFPGHPGKDKASQMTTSLEAQRTPVLLQQAIPPGASSNILHGPAFIFPLNQQHVAAATTAASTRPGPSKPLNVSNAASTPGAAGGSASATSSVAAAATSFSYPSMPGGETQYLTILQNNSYPLSVPVHAGATPVYRGTHPQAMPFFNGPFYSSQMLHPSQLPQQVPANLLQLQQGQAHQNASVSSDLSTMNHLQNHQQRPLCSVVNGSSGSLQGFPSGKNQPSTQTLTLQPQFNQQQPHQLRPIESAAAGKDIPSTADTQIPRANMTTINGQNFAMPIHSPNFTPMTQSPPSGANGNNPGEKQRPQMTRHHQSSKQSANDSLHSHAFGLSFGNAGNSASAHSLDISSIGQGHTILQSLPDATRQAYQIMAAAAAAQNAQQKNVRVSDEGSRGVGNDASSDDDRKPLGGKSSVTGGQSIAFSRPDLMDTSISSLPGSGVVDSSVRTLNLGSGSSRGASTTLGSPSAQQLQRSRQMIQLQKQHQFASAAAASARSKTAATSNGSVYSEHLSASTSAAAWYASSLSSFPQNLIQGSGSPTQSPQWLGSTRPAVSPMPSSLAPATATAPSLKLLSQQPGRVPPGQTHISFAISNAKPGNASQGLQTPASGQQSPSQVVVGSPTTSSVSKSTGSSPRTTVSSTGNKPVLAASSLQTQQARNSPQSMPMHKSLPVGSGSSPSILGNSPLTASSGIGTKHHLPPPQLLSKQNLQQAQFFSHPYTPVPVQAAHSTTNSASTVSATSAHYMQRCPSDWQPKVQQLPQGSAPSPSSLAMSLLCPPAKLTSSGTCNPVKAAAVGNLKGSNLQSQGNLHAAPFSVTRSSGGSRQIVPVGFSYVHTSPNAVQAKPAEQKPPAGE